MSDINPRSESVVRNAISGSIAGLVAAVATCPFDMIRLQIQNDLTKTTIQTLQKILSEEGVRGLYRGVYATGAGYLPTWAIYFSLYDTSKTYYMNNGFLSDSASHCLSAIQAGFLCTVATNPLWVVRTRIMTQPSRYSPSAPYYYKSVRNALIEIPRKEGWQALFKGLGPSMMGVGNVAIQFPLYEKIKSQQSKYPAIDTWNFIIFASATSKVIASGFTYPHEVVRTRLQTQSSMSKAATIYTGVWQTIGLVYRNEGIRGFYRGYLLGLLRTVPASALTIFTFEYVNSFLETHL